MMSVTNDLRIRRYILAGIMLAVVLGLTFSGVGGSGAVAISGCNQPVSLIQCGTTSCTITLPASFCTVTVTFPIAFAANPKFTAASWIGFNGGPNHPERQIPAFSLNFQADNGETWVNMPVALTEIYGNTNHESSLDSGSILSSANQAEFFASCLVGSTSASATLRPEYFDNLVSGTWKELALVPGFLDINFGTAFCAPGGGGGSSLSSASSGITPGVVGTQTELRVVGFGGGGIGDTPILNNISLVFFTTILQTPSICVANVASTGNGCPIGVSPANRKTQMIIIATINYPPISGFEVDMNWEASE
jgi:hypothetical protein